MYSVISFSLFLKERATKHWVSKPAHITAIWIDYHIMSLHIVEVGRFNVWKAQHATMI